VLLSVPVSVSTPVHAIKKGELHVRVLRVCIFFGSHVVASIRSRSLEAAGHLCARSSVFLVMCSPLLKQSLISSHQPAEVLSRALTFVLQFLQEEKRVNQERNRKLKQKEEDQEDEDALKEDEKEPSEDFYDGTASVSATVVNEHWPSVLELVCFVSSPPVPASDGSVRAAAVALVAEALAQGLVLGTTCVAPLMAVLLDEDAVRSNAVLSVLTHRMEKSKSFVSQVVGQLEQGITSALLFCKRGGIDSCKASAHLFAGLFRAVRDHTKQRNLFLQELVACWEAAIAAAPQIDVVRVEFLATAMAFLPFNNEHGPLFVCYSMNRIVALHAQYDNDDDDDEDDNDDDDEDDGDEKEKEKSNLDVALSVALQLKTHLKSVYKISNAKLLSFLPHKPADKESVKNGGQLAAVLHAPQFDLSISLKEMMECDDFNTENMVKKTTTRKKRTNAKPRAAKVAPKRKTKRNRREEFEDEDDEDFE
jgi:hypothetical protein